MGQENYKEIVFQVTSYIKSNAGKPFSIPDVAKAVGYSERHIRRAFSLVLGQSVVSFLQAEKIRKAKSLLLDTHLDVANVALDSGFENPANFSKVFREKVGLTPSAFRKKALAMKENPQPRIRELDFELDQPNELYRDFFPGTGLGPNWKIVWGEWSNRDGLLSATGAQNGVNFLRPLPENCRISFEALSVSIPDSTSPNFGLSLLDDQFNAEYCAFTLASGGATTGHLRHYRGGRQWNPAARISENEWHEIVLEIREDTLALSVDGREFFLLRDSFSPAYSSRCNLHLASWHCALQIRKFVLQDLGFFPATRAIRQGDALYNAGLYEKAMDFYARFLKSGSATEIETMELRYKIGMCAMRENAFSIALDWMDKVVALREDKFWSEQARLAVLETNWRKSDLDAFRESMQACIEDPATRGGARVIVQKAVEDLSGRGFVADSITILETWLKHERGDAIAFQVIHSLLAEHLLRARRYGDAKDVLMALMQSAELPDLKLSSEIDLMHLYCEWGRTAECDQVRWNIEKNAKNSYILARCRINRAMAFRCREQFDTALDIYLSMPNEFPLETKICHHAQILAVHIFCGLGDPARARGLLRNVATAAPGRYFGSKDFLPVFVAERDYNAAADILLQEYPTNDLVLSILPETGIKAGIFLELAGSAQNAKDLFEEVSRRFPAGRICFLGPLAAALAGNEPFDIGAMPYEHHKRSEMFYLIGLLKQKRGQSSEAKALFAMSVREDPTFRWPAHFSQLQLKKLG